MARRPHVHGTGFGLVADIALGIVGALLGSWLFPRLGIHLGGEPVGEIIIATIGAVVLLILLGLFQRSGGRVFLTPPAYPIFIISLVLAIIAMLIFYAGVRIPVLSGFRAFDLLTLAYIALLAGVLFRGI